jgi:predicted amidohydrolase YtcJ
VGGQEVLLGALVLDEGDGVGGGADGHAGGGEAPEAGDADVLDFDGQYVEALAEGLNRVGVVEVSFDEAVGEVPAGGIRVRIHDLDPQVPIDGRLDHHPSELATAEHAEAERGTEGEVVAHAAKIFRRYSAPSWYATTSRSTLTSPGTGRCGA